MDQIISVEGKVFGQKATFTVADHGPFNPLGCTIAAARQWAAPLARKLGAGPENDPTAHRFTTLVFASGTAWTPHTSVLDDLEAGRDLVTVVRCAAGCGDERAAVLIAYMQSSAVEALRDAHWKLYADIIEKADEPKRTQEILAAHRSITMYDADYLAAARAAKAAGVKAIALVALAYGVNLPDLARAA